MKGDKEYRYFKVEGLRIERRGLEPAKIVGYAAVFDKDSENLGGFTERIAPGAFKKAIKTSDARSLINHDSNLILGRQSAGTLVLKEDKNGLLSETIPPDTSYARDLMVSIDRGDIQEMSFGFTIESDQWEDMDKPDAKRTILKVRELFDISPVTYPAYPDTSVALRSLEAAKKDHPTMAEDQDAPTSAEVQATMFEKLNSLINKG